MPRSQFALQGAGHLATALVEGFSRARAGPISIYDHTPARAQALAKRFPALTVFERESREVERIFASVGSVVRLESDDEIDRLSVLTSCLPGILAAMLDELASTYALDERQTRDLLLESALGSILVAQEKETSLADLVTSVANPGDLTEAGVSVIRRTMPSLFAELKQSMDARIRERHLRLIADS